MRGKRCPRAVAAERKLRALNSEIKIEGVVADLNSGMSRKLLSGFPLILDGTDNFETRFLVNDFAVRAAIPWIYAAAGCELRPDTDDSAATNRLSGMLAGNRRCACLEETCDTVGVLGPIVNLIASLEAAEALKLLSGNQAELHGRLISCDVWTGPLPIGSATRESQLPRLRPGANFRISRARPSRISRCAGRDSVQIHERGRTLDLPALQQRLGFHHSRVRQNGFLLRFQLAPYEMTIFSDGRAILKGTKDPAIARSLYAKYVGA